ncbi:hypothetical protein LTR94_032558, partial [Friedmanniomyces endolithicus]
MAAPNTGSYCASKGGVRLFTKATAMECAELGNGVRANSIHPGHVETPLTAGAYADPVIAARLKADIPMKRQGQADEIADAILFLASDESSYVTGAEIVVDGGWTAVLESKYSYRDRWLAVRSDTVRVPNGTILSPYHTI